jgi:hypothetical protein
MTGSTQTLPYGSWPSPITAASLVQGASAVGEIRADGDDVTGSVRHRDAAIGHRDHAVDDGEVVEVQRTRADADQNLARAGCRVLAGFDDKLVGRALRLHGCDFHGVLLGNGRYAAT